MQQTALRILRNLTSNVFVDRDIFNTLVAVSFYESVQCKRRRCCTFVCQKHSASDEFSGRGFRVYRRGGPHCAIVRSVSSLFLVVIPLCYSIGIAIPHPYIVFGAGEELTCITTTFVSTPSPQQEDLLSKVIAVSDSAQASRQDEAASLEAIDPRGEPVARVAADIVGHLQCAHRLEAPPIG